MYNLRQSSRFTERLPPRGFSENDAIPLGAWDTPLEIWDKLDSRVMPRDMYKRAMESRVHELDAAIRRFIDCGVELSRFSIEEHPGESRLCVDGIARFAWRLNYPDGV